MSIVQIVSSPLRPADSGEGEACPLATVVDRRTVFVGVGQGSIADARDTADMTHEGWECLRVLREHAKAQEAHGKLQLVEVSHLRQVAHHVCHVLKGASQGDVVFFVCTDNDIVDAVWDALNVVECPSPYSKH